MACIAAERAKKWLCTVRCDMVHQLCSQAAGMQVSCCSSTPTTSMLEPWPTCTRVSPIICSAAGYVLLHDFRSGAKLAALAGDGPARSALQFCQADPDLLAAAGDAGGGVVWSVRALSPRHELQRLHRVRAASPAYV